ncbi:hypothetical protein WA026_004910 [Henosepilachna vigintioctopunctata]|uniref:Ig-like domain-containing protein n=1 Tax=Henosepilachna vigintioctopunctata TaxID=420089 RepID=A0AAW1USZ6_9CUCU
MSQKDNIYKLEIENAKVDDIDNYTCSVEDDVREIPVFIKPLVKMPGNINTVENEKLKIHCSVYGDPVPEIFWTYSNDTSNFTSIESINDTNSIITLEMDDKKIENSILLIHNVQMWHRGEYSCFGKPPYNHKLVNATVMVRVKGMYADNDYFKKPNKINEFIWFLCALSFAFESLEIQKSSNFFVLNILHYLSLYNTTYRLFLS